MPNSSNELLAHLVGVQTEGTPAPIDLLEILRETPQGPSELARDRPISRKSVYSALDPLVEEYILVREKGDYALTGYGAVLCTALETATEPPAFDRAGLRFLLASTNRVALLQTLRASPARKATLATGEAAPSRTTVHRAIEAFTEKGWVTQNSTGQYTLTETGEGALAAFTRLLDDFVVAQSASTFLYCCDEAVADIPLDGLANAELHVDRPEAHDTSRGVLHELVTPELDSFQGFLSSVSTASADVGDSIIRSGTHTELIIPEPVFYELPTKGHYSEHVKRGLEAKNFDFFIIPNVESLPIGLAIFDGETVLMSPANLNHVPPGGNAGTVVSSDEALVEWATALYAEHHAQARTPGEHIIERLKEKLAEGASVLTRSNSMTD